LPKLSTGRVVARSIGSLQKLSTGRVVPGGLGPLPKLSTGRVVPRGLGPLPKLSTGRVIARSIGSLPKLSTGRVVPGGLGPLQKLSTRRVISRGLGLCRSCPPDEWSQGVLALSRGYPPLQELARAQNSLFEFAPENREHESNECSFIAAVSVIALDRGCLVLYLAFMPMSRTASVQPPLLGECEVKWLVVAVSVRFEWG
jgi:hypothetical protein